MQKIKSLISVVLAFVLISTGCGYSAERHEAISEKTANNLLPSVPPFPGENELSEASFVELLDQIGGNSSINTVIVLKDSNTVQERYKYGYDKDSVVTFNSCAKSITSILIGIAIDQGLIESIDTKISVYFPEILDDTDSRKQEITIKHLLEFTAGFDWPEWGTWNYWPGEFVSSENWVDFVLSRPMIAEPGTEFAYNTGASQLLSAILQKATGEDAFTFAEKNLFVPLDIQDVTWGKDPQGITTGGFQISMKPSDAAKIGLLYLNNGNYDGKQIVSETWVEESTQAHSQGGYFGSKYGYHWWVEDTGEVNYYYAMGYGGQYIFIAPERNLVAVFSSNLSLQQMDLPKTYFELLIGNA